MQIIPFSEQHLPAAAKLAAADHAQERALTGLLPERAAEHYLPLLRRLMTEVPGAAAVDASGHLLGYLIGTKVREFKGTERGIYVAEWGFSAQGEQRQRVMQHLYEYLAARWVENGCFAHAITLYAHDQLALQTWWHGGFGMICGDAVRSLQSVAGAEGWRVKTRLAEPSDLPALMELVHEHQRYYPRSPLFMPLLELDSAEEYRDWLASPDRAIWLAWDDQGLTGYYKCGPAHSGAAHLIAEGATCSVSGAYVRPEQRQGGIGAALLQRTVDWATQAGYQRCAVDFETHNIYGSRFWHRHFTPVAYSLLRKLDQRVAWAHASRSAEGIW